MTDGLRDNLGVLLGQLARRCHRVSSGQNQAGVRSERNAARRLLEDGIVPCRGPVEVLQMQKPVAGTPEEQHYTLASSPPGPVQKRFALVVVLGLLTVFVLITAGPLSSIQTGQVTAFIPIYLTWMFVNDSITAILLFAQFSIQRSRAVLVIANGYLFTALMLIPYILTFPGVFARLGLFGGLQSTSWIYFFQYAVFPIFVIAYALLKDADPSKRYWRGAARTAIVLSAASTIALVLMASALFIAGEALLPPIMLDPSHFGSLWPYVGLPVALVSVAAFIALWFRRRSMLDLWLLVVMSAYSMLIPLNYFSTPMRFGIGWYAVRTFATISSSLVLIFLLYEITMLYGRLLGAILDQRRERDARLMTGDAVAATMAHEFRQPLAAMMTRADTGFRWLDRQSPDLDKAKAAFKQIGADGQRAEAVIESIRTSLKQQNQIRALLDVNDLIGEALTLARDDLRSHRILLSAEPNSGLPQIMGDRIQLRQVLLNLIANAIDSMAVEDGPRVLSVSSEVHGGDDVVVSVADTGAGIGSQDVQRVFNPLFTTKSGGMGLGLSICRSIIEGHHGRLAVVPNTPKGAVFQIALPRYAPDFGRDIGR
jgi:signal transduction histidine kinase